jgi:hypothetical protein
MMKHRVNITQIRCLAGSYRAVELEACILEMLEKGSNNCLAMQDRTEGISILSMAKFVRSQMEEDGVSVFLALRRLGQRMRGVVSV